MIRTLLHVKDVLQGKASVGCLRSTEWRRVRALHLIANPDCALCGGHEKLQVHHIKPFHLYTELELDPTNLITLCEAKNDGVNCHLHYGHLGNFKSFNETVDPDVRAMRTKIIDRPFKR